MLARVVCVDGADGRVLVDSFVRPGAPVTDFRAAITGIGPADLAGAPSFTAVRRRVADLICGDVLVVGHALHHDLRVLRLRVPAHRLRDTAKYAALRPPDRPLAQGGGDPGLRALCEHWLGRYDVQPPGRAHCPVEDARAALALYALVRDRWEADNGAAAPLAETKTTTRKKKKKKRVTSQPPLSPPNDTR